MHRVRQRARQHPERHQRCRRCPPACRGGRGRVGFDTTEPCPPGAIGRRGRSEVGHRRPLDGVVDAAERDRFVVVDGSHHRRLPRAVPARSPVGRRRPLRPGAGVPEWARTTHRWSAFCRRSCTISSPDRIVDAQCTNFSLSPSCHGRTPSIAPLIAPLAPDRSPSEAIPARSISTGRCVQCRRDEMTCDRHVGTTTPPDRARAVRRCGSGPRVRRPDPRCSKTASPAELGSGGPAERDLATAGSDLDEHRSRRCDLDRRSAPETPWSDERGTTIVTELGPHRGQPSVEQCADEHHEAGGEHDHDRGRSRESGDRERHPARRAAARVRRPTLRRVGSRHDLTSRRRRRHMVEGTPERRLDRRRPSRSHRSRAHDATARRSASAMTSSGTT